MVSVHINVSQAEPGYDVTGLAGVVATALSNGGRTVTDVLRSTFMAKRTRKKPESPLKRELKRLTPAPPGRKRPKLGPDRSPQRDSRDTPAKE